MVRKIQFGDSKTIDTCICFQALKIVLLGATGDTGKPLLSTILCVIHQKQTYSEYDPCVSELLLKNGHKVTAVVRDGTKLKEDHANRSKVQADVFNAESLVSIFRGTQIL